LPGECRRRGALRVAFPRLKGQREPQGLTRREIPFPVESVKGRASRCKNTFPLRAMLHERDTARQ
jgi:hypothetical protein